MPPVTAAIPTVEDLQKLSAEIGRIGGEIETTLWKFRGVHEDDPRAATFEGPRRTIGAAELGNITYFAEGLLLDAQSFTDWAKGFKDVADDLFEGWLPTGRTI